MDLEPVSLGPFGGADPSIVDDRFVQGTKLRGGQNAIVLEGEWWARGGLQWLLTMPRSFGGENTILWRKILPYEDVNEAGTTQRSRVFFLSRYGVFSIDPTVGDAVTPWHYDYVSLTSGSVTAVNGSLMVVSSSTLGGKFIWDEATGYVYGIKNTAGPQYRLDRPWQGASGAVSVKIVPTMASAYSLTSDVSDATIFRHVPDYSAGGEVYTSSPVVRGAATYLVITFGPSAADDPIAIRVDVDTPVIPATSWFRNSSTTTSPTTKLAVQPRYARAYKERLILGFAADPTGKNPAVTWWYSAPGDLVSWHTGTPGQGASPNVIKFTDSRDPITGLEVSSDLLTIHRAESQMVVQFQPTGPFALDMTPNRQGYGLQNNDLRSLIVANNTQYLLTEGGPAQFSGGQMQYIDPAISDLFIRFRDTATSTVPLYTGHIGWHSPNQGLLGWILRTTTEMSSQQVHGVPWIVLDYRRGRWMLLTVPNFGPGEYPEAAGPEHIATSSGLIFKVPVPIWSGYAYDQIEVEQYAPTPVLVDAQCETPWLDFGTPEQKYLAHIDVMLRATHQPVAAGALVGVPDPASLTLEVFADYRDDTARESFEISVAQSDFASESGFMAPARTIKRVVADMQGSVFKLRFSGDPFRLSNVVVWMRPTSSREKEI